MKIIFLRGWFLFWFLKLKSVQWPKWNKLNNWWRRLAIFLNVRLKNRGSLIVTHYSFRPAFTVLWNFGSRNDSPLYIQWFKKRFTPLWSWTRPRYPLTPPPPPKKSQSKKNGTKINLSLIQNMYKVSLYSAACRGCQHSMHKSNRNIVQSADSLWVPFECILSM